jgi:very-short-patch-repair endonuclease
MLLRVLNALGYDTVGWVKEYKFHDTRRWRVDFAHPGKKLAIEVEGGVWTQGRHTRGSGFVKDMEKYNELAIYGFALLRIQPNDIDKRPGWIKDQLERIEERRSQ